MIITQKQKQIPTCWKLTYLKPFIAHSVRRAVIYWGICYTIVGRYGNIYLSHLLFPGACIAHINNIGVTVVLREGAPV